VTREPERPAAPAQDKTVFDLLRTTCRELVELLDASTAVVSRVIGDLLVELVVFTRADRPLQLGHEYLISDFPLTAEVITRLEPRRVSRLDADADPHEASLLEQFGFDSLLMLPVAPHGEAWALLEVYHEHGRRFSDDDERLALPAVERAAAALEQLAPRG
jgi:GAF domain-containing protein